MMTFTRRSAAGLMLAAFAAPLAGTPTRRTIAVLMDSLTSPFWIAGLAAMHREAARRGWDVLEAVSNQDDNRQFQQLRAMIQRGVDGIIMVHTDDKAVIPAIHAANSAGIPLVHFNRPPAPNNGYSVAVVADNRKLMRETVEALFAKARQQGGSYRAAILLGDLSDVNAVNRRLGFEDALARNGDIVTLVAEVATEWNADKAFAGLVNALQAHPDINLLVTSSDFMAPQIEQALRAADKWYPAGTRGHVFLCGFDGDSNAYRDLRSGYFDATGVQDLDYEVRLSCDAISAMWHGQRPPKILVDPGFVATRDNLKLIARRMWGYEVLMTPAATAMGTTPVAGSVGNASTGWSLASIASAVSSLAAALFAVATLGDIALSLLPLLILVLGQMTVMLIGEIDLSVTAVLALASIGGASVMTELLGNTAPGVQTIAGIVACCLVGVAFGLFNGLCVAALRMPSFIVTLAVAMIGSGAAVWYASAATASMSIGGLPASFIELGYGNFLGVPISGLIALIIAGCFWFMLNRTVSGRWLYATGQNRKAARIAGVPVAKVTISAFAVSGLCAAIAAILYTARVETGQPTLGADLLLDIIGAAVIGGISLFGGRGTVWMALGGAAFLTVLDKVLQLLGLSLFLVLAIKGVAVLAAALFDRRRQQRRRATA